MQAATLAPTTWTSGTPLGIGYTVRAATGTRLAKWGPAGAYAESNVVDNLYTGFGTVDVLLHQRSGYSAATDTITLTTRASIPAATPPGTYSTTVLLTALANP
ncbi:MAG: hypothetical protein JWM90_2561, partial [Thermoleophilia bacterium]|nr:hypothetical protein [Thermoleophilia bacterium]